MSFRFDRNIIAPTFMFVNRFLMFYDNFFVLYIKIALVPFGTRAFVCHF